MHFFSTPSFFAGALAADPSLANARPADVHVPDDDGGSLRFRVLVDRRGRPLPELPFLDYLVPLDGDVPAAPLSIEVTHLDNTVVEGIGVSEFVSRQEADGLVTSDLPRPDDAGGPRRVAPYIDWREFDTWDDFAAAARSSSKSALRQTRRATSLIEKRFGAAPTFCYDDPDPDRFEQCLEWKRQQYVAGGNDDLITAGAGSLMRHLRDAGEVLCSTLCVGDRLLAAHIGFVHDETFNYWLPAYDADAAKAAPGMYLLELLLMESHRRGHVEFDFLEGQERYKFAYATGVRVIGTSGTPALPLRTARRLRRRVGSELRERDVRRRVSEVVETVRRRRARRD